MKSIRVGLVTEGSTDQVVIRALLAEHFCQNTPDVEIAFVDLQPTRDQTSASSEGGWQMVYRWCVRNTPSVRAGRFLGGGLFASDMDAHCCDLIVVHLDSRHLCGY